MLCGHEQWVRQCGGSEGAAPGMPDEGIHIFVRTRWCARTPSEGEVQTLFQKKEI